MPNQNDNYCYNTKSIIDNYVGSIEEKDNLHYILDFIENIIRIKNNSSDILLFQDHNEGFYDQIINNRLILRIFDTATGYLPLTKEHKSELLQKDISNRSGSDEKQFKTDYIIKYNNKETMFGESEIPNDDFHNFEDAIKLSNYLKLLWDKGYENRTKNSGDDYLFKTFFFCFQINGTHLTILSIIRPFSKYFITYILKEVEIPIKKEFKELIQNWDKFLNSLLEACCTMIVLKSIIRNNGRLNSSSSESNSSTIEIEDVNAILYKKSVIPKDNSEKTNEEKKSKDVNKKNKDENSEVIDFQHMYTHRRECLKTRRMVNSRRSLR